MIVTVLAFYSIRSFGRNRVCDCRNLCHGCEEGAEERQRKTRVLEGFPKNVVNSMHQFDEIARPWGIIDFVNERFNVEREWLHHGP